MTVSKSAIVGSLLGTAVGDALGLPIEGLSRRRAARLIGELDSYRLVFGRGMVSDDTEHACMVAQALIASGNDPDMLAHQLVKRLRWWLYSLPAGTGAATLKACLKLCIGFPPSRSGVFSAGNGPAMRSPILGAAIDDVDLLNELVRASTRITHTDPKAKHGALAVAVAARMASGGGVIQAAEFVERIGRRVSATDCAGCREPRSRGNNRSVRRVPRPGARRFRLRLSHRAGRLARVAVKSAGLSGCGHERDSLRRRYGQHGSDHWRDCRLRGGQGRNSGRVAEWTLGMAADGGLDGNAN